MTRGGKPETARRNARIIAMARQGLSLQIIVEKIGLSPGRTSKVLRAAGVISVGMQLAGGRPRRDCVIGGPHPPGINTRSCRHCTAAYAAQSRARHRPPGMTKIIRCSIPGCGWPLKQPGVCTPEDGAAACWRRREVRP